MSDALGLVETREESTVAPTLQVQPLWDEPTTASSAATTTLPVPLAGAPASLDYTVQATDQAGRVTRTPAVWPVLPNEDPAGTVTLAAGTATPVRAGYPFSVVVHATDRERLSRITLQASGPVTPASQATTVAGTVADQSYTLNVPASADGSQPVSVQALIEDASGGATTTAPLQVPVAANGAPTGVLALASGAPSRIEAGESTTIQVHAEDTDGLVRIDLHVDGPVTQPEQTRTVSGTAVDATFTVTARTDATPQTVSVTATLVDQLDSAATTAAVTFDIVSDNTSPVVTLTLQPDRGAGGIYHSGETVTVGASATDDQGVTSLQLVVDGTTTSSTGAPVSYDWAVPEVTASTSYTLEATATDGDGNEAQATRTVTVAPVPADQPPAVSFACPSTGALLPDDYVAKLTAAASDDLGVTAVRFFLEDATTPFAEVTPSGSPAPPQTTATATFDLATVSTPSVHFRVEAVDTTGQTQSAVIEVQRVAVVDLRADGQGSNDWTALAGQTVALRSGTLTIDQSVTVGGLLVLDGAKITHSAATGATSPGRVALTVNGETYVGCGGAIDVSERGYGPGVTYPGAVVSGVQAGGSHLGEGGPIVGRAVGETYGSV